MLTRFHSYLYLCLLCFLSFAPQCFADDLELSVTGPFINVHSGPATEFPIFYVLSEGEKFSVLKEKTGWYKIEAKRDISGWIKASDLSLSALKDGTQIGVNAESFDDYLERDWELIVQGGAIDKVTTMSVGTAWVWTKNLAVEATYSQALGDFADSKIWSLRMRQTFFPNWKVSPYLALGTGEIRTKPRSNLVQSGDEVRKSNHYEVGIGAQYYFAPGVLIRAEYRGLLALTDRDEQERLDQWMLGVSVFF